MNQKQTKAIKLVERILVARRSNDLKKEQKAHEAFTIFCDENDFDFEVTFDACCRMIKKINPIASSINYGAF